MGQLTNLEELTLRDNRLTTLPPELNQLTKLKRLQIARNNFTQPPPVVEQLRARGVDVIP
ncbi:MAG: leucine-rich repeat domain-containing protein [Anaerolineales bacterium]|nr:leucine-rich repeat domain-containing protein [Anaerolineales bacterium]